MRNLSYISFDEFKKVKLVVGKIVDVIDHPKADKLYVLKVDMGGETRTLVAGIKKWYKKDELLNKYIIVVTNLEPKEIRGVRSEGMLLAADDGEIVSVLTVDKKVRLGARVL